MPRASWRYFLYRWAEARLLQGMQTELLLRGIIAQNTTPSIPKWMVKHMQTTVIKMMMGSLEASCSQKQMPPLRRSRSQKQRLPPRRQVAWRRDRKRFSYCLVCISSAISIPSSRFHSFPFISIHFHISSLFHFHFHFHFQYTPRSDTKSINQSLIFIFLNFLFQIRSINRPAAKKKTSPRGS